MTKFQTDPPFPKVLAFPGLRVRCVGNEPALVISGDIIDVALRVPTRRELIHRLFGIPSLERLRVSLRRGEVRLDFLSTGQTHRELITELAAALRGGKPAPIELPHEEAVLQRRAPRVFEIRRASKGQGLTLWQIETPSPRVIYVTHPLLHDEFVRRQVLDELATISDVVQRSVPLPIPGRESIVVFVRPHRMDPPLLTEVLDPVLTRCLATGPVHQAAGRNDLLVNANLAVSPVADLIFPPLGLANVGLTWLLSRGYISHAMAALERGKFTLELLHLVIAGLTVATYQFLPSAIMLWLMRFWPRRSRRFCDAQHMSFLARYSYRPRRVWIEREGLAMETRVEDLRPANVVTLGAGDIVPGDGHIVGGSAQLDERLLTGVPKPVTRAEGSAIYAGTRLLEGDVRMKIDALGKDTASARLAGWIDHALKTAEPRGQIVKAAEATVLPTLIAGTASILTGGLAAAKAVLRPDYFTGPAVSDKMVGLATAMRAAHEGILIQRRDALEKILAPACVVFDDSVPWQTPELRGGDFFEHAQAQGLAEVVYFGSGSKAETASHGVRLGFQTVFAAGSTAAKVAFIAERQRLGQSVVYVGDCVGENPIARQANLAVAVLEPPYQESSPAPVVLLAPDLSRFLQLHALAAEVAAEAQTAFRLALLPNVAAVGGAFLFGSPIWASLVLTNLGTFANYLRSSSLLRLAEVETRM